MKTQQLSDAGTTARNVHNDACLFDESGADYSGTVTFESTGVGFISACPDPDTVTDSSGTVTNGAGVAYTHDHDGDTFADHCHQTAFQTKNAAGDGEYHARLNNTTAAGDQTVDFCFDPQQDPSMAAGAQPAGHGCSDQTEELTDTIIVHWTTSAPAPAQAVSYINPDAGAATANPSVDPGSDCETPDREDRQVLSDAGMTTRNVHNDSCLFDASGDDFNGAATYESTGVGHISACPDPDSVTDSTGTVTNGPGVAFTHDHDGDTFADHCHQSGFQSKGVAGDGEYHARLNNTSAAGDQNVTFCSDPEQDAAMAAGSQPAGHGCGDTTVKDLIVIQWITDAPVQSASSVTIERDKPFFRGTVFSGDDRCLEGRSVQLRKAQRGPDRFIKETTTDESGDYSIQKRRAKGRFYVKVASLVFTDAEGIEVTCGADRSRTLRLR